MRGTFTFLYLGLIIVGIFNTALHHESVQSIKQVGWFTLYPILAGFVIWFLAAVFDTAFLIERKWHARKKRKKGK